jgi:hypothetical protein
MTLQRWIIVGILLLFVLAGCGGSNSGVTYAGHPHPSKKRVTWENLNNYAYITRFRMDNGKILVCAEDSSGDGALTMSCNWQLFNQESGR